MRISKPRPAIAMLLLLLPLCGCYADQKKAVADCTPPIKKIWSQEFREEYLDTHAQEIVSCMKQAGYRRNTQSPQCLTGNATDPRCYIPASPWGKFTYVFFESGR
jgi:hypothetical protein